MAYCQKLAKNGYFQSSCPDCQEACEGERESMETTIKQCRKTTTHYRYRLQKIQGHLSNNTSVYQRCKYQLKMKDYRALGKLGFDKKKTGIFRIWVLLP